MENPQELIVPVETMNAVMAYIATQPLKDVIGLYSKIQQTARPYVPPTAPETDKPQINERA